MKSAGRNIAGLAAVVVAMGSLSACGTSATQSTSSAKANAAPAEQTCAGTPTRQKGISGTFNEIYDGDFTPNNTNAPYDKFNLMMVAFGHVNSSGEFDFENVSDGGVPAEKARLQTLLSNTKALRDAGKLKIVMSLGWGTKFNDIPIIEKNPQKFAASVNTFIINNDLDGFDIDYESPTFSSEQKMSDVSIAIRQAIGQDKLFTITPNNVTNLVGATLSSCYNYVNTQSYNASSDLAFSVSQVTALGVPGSMINAGADIENVNHYGGDKNRVAFAVNQYQKLNLNGVFMWQLKPGTNRYPAGGPTVNDYANQMWTATGLH